MSWGWKDEKRGEKDAASSGGNHGTHHGQDSRCTDGPVLRPLSWLFVDMNSYFASVEQEINPQYRNKPIAVVPMLADTTCCIAASYEAKAYGVKTGTMVREARKMCPGIIFVDGAHDKYVEYHHKIIDAVESCIPVSAVCSIDEVACRLRGSDQEEKNAVNIAYEIKRALNEKVGRFLKGSVGIGPNRLLAKLASDMQKPDGLTVIRQEDLPGKLLHLKPRDFAGIGSRMEKRLSQYGVRTMEKLYGLTRKEMRQIWGGVNGEWFYEWMRGLDTAADRTDDTKSVGHSHVLAPELRNPVGAWGVAQKLLHKVGARLRRYKMWTRGISLHISYKDHDSWGDSLSLVECQDTLTLLEALTELWSRAPKDDLMKIGITLYNLVGEDDHNLTFFGDHIRRENLSTALDKINGKFGGRSAYFGGMHEAKESAPTRIAFTQIPEAPDFED